MPNAGKNQLNVILDYDLKKRFRQKAFSEGTTATELLKQWIDNYMEEESPAPSPEIEQLRKEVDRHFSSLQSQLDQLKRTPSETSLEPTKDGDEDVSPYKIIKL